ncbi:MAG: molybdopterin-dependent oxidoreductase [Spirochaetes bacterium]|nr:molybdopterin-dependent oxidoreductase [Spirochaetota bacterium]
MKLERKDFLTMIGGAVVGTGVGTVISPGPWMGLQWLVEWTQDQYRPPKGEEKYLASICDRCPNKCTIQVRKIGNRAVKIETSNQGCAVGQLLLQVLYHPERVTTPLKRTGKKGKIDFAPVSWDEAIADISKKINDAINNNKQEQIVAINPAYPDATSMLTERIALFSGSPYVFQESGYWALSNACSEIAFKTDGAIDYDFENADCVVSFGARLFEGWGNPGRMHNVLSLWKKKGIKFIQIDSIATRTASLADQWVAIKPGSEPLFAMGVAHYLMKYGKRSGAANFGRFTELLINKYTPEKVSELTGVSLETIEYVAKALISAQRPIAVAGRGGKVNSSSVAEFSIIQTINNMIGSMGTSVKLTSFTTPVQPVIPKKAKGLDEYIASDSVCDIAIINNANPVYSSVYGQRLSDKLKKASTVVLLTSLLNDTALYADYVFPTITSLEIPVAGDAAVTLTSDAKHAGDSLLGIAKSIAKISSQFPWKNYLETVQTVKHQTKNIANLDIPVDLIITKLEETEKILSASGSYSIAMIPFEIPTVSDGSGLSLPYVLKGLPDTILKGDTSWVLMNPATASKEGISEGSKIDIESSRGELDTVRVHLTKRIAYDTIAIPIGFGHEEFTDYASEKGVNPKKIMSDAVDPASGYADWWLTRVKLS